MCDADPTLLRIIARLARLRAVERGMYQEEDGMALLGAQCALEQAADDLEAAADYLEREGRRRNG
jgi:hypothetical protein